MMPWEIFLSGLIVGWLIELGLDVFFWRPRRVCSEAERELQEAVTILEEEVLRLRRQNRQTSKGEKELEDDGEEEDEKRQQDDLKKIWGIGPKIETLLWLQGITTFQQLSTKTHEELDGMLANAGERFRISRENVLDSWQEQARLAAAGRWVELDALQKRISRTRRFGIGARRR
jgi:predicted flap endonuclease-1-like 5' DNA nuclease